MQEYKTRWQEAQRDLQAQLNAAKKVRLLVKPQTMNFLLEVLFSQDDFYVTFYFVCSAMHALTISFYIHV